MSEDTPRAVRALPESGRDYLRKRRNGEGSRRRNLRRLGDTLDDTLDEENKQIWDSVYSACLAQIGKSPAWASAQKWRTSDGSRAALHRGAAMLICSVYYQIPHARLDDLSGRRRGAQEWVTRQRRPEETSAIVDRWHAEGGPVNTKMDLIFQGITKDAAEALAAAALASGESPAVIASAAILTACAIVRG